MIVEVVAALILGVVALVLVVEPLVRVTREQRDAPADLVDPEETPSGAALAALKEIEFDRETGKLSDTDYLQLKERYTKVAIQAMREERAGSPAPTAGAGGASDPVEAIIAAKVRALRSASAMSGSDAPACPTCGPRPESDAVFCSTCGNRLPTGRTCVGCNAPLPPDGSFCEACGRKVAA